MREHKSGPECSTRSRNIYVAVRSRANRGLMETDGDTKSIADAARRGGEKKHKLNRPRKTKAGQAGGEDDAGVEHIVFFCF